MYTCAAFFNSLGSWTKNRKLNFLKLNSLNLICIIFVSKCGHTCQILLKRALNAFVCEALVISLTKQQQTFLVSHRFSHTYWRKHTNSQMQIGCENLGQNASSRRGFAWWPSSSSEATVLPGVRHKSWKFNVTYRQCCWPQKKLRHHH